MWDLAGGVKENLFSLNLRLIKSINNVQTDNVGTRVNLSVPITDLQNRGHSTMKDVSRGHFIAKFIYYIDGHFCFKAWTKKKTDLLVPYIWF